MGMDIRLLTPAEADAITDQLDDHQSRLAGIESHETAVDDAIGLLDQRLSALELQSPGAGGWTQIASAEADMDDHIDLIVPADHDRLRLSCSYVTADIQPGSVLTTYLSADGVNFDTGNNYMNILNVSWPGEPNQAGWDVQPWPTLPQTLDLGCRLAIDVGERLDVATHTSVDLTAMGSVSGNPVSPIYRSIGHVGFIGGAAGVSARPSFHGGGTWFAGDPVGTPFDWTGSFRFDGHWKSPGSRIRGIRLTMDGGGTYGRKIKTGRFILEAK